MGLHHRAVSAFFPGFAEKRALVSRGPGAAVLMYHEVLPDSADMPNWSVVRASEFRRQMTHLRDHYEVLSIDELLARMPVAGEHVRPRVAITFDDGYAGNLLWAAPILEQLGLPFTVYIATSRVEDGGLHWYDKVMLGLLSKGRNPLEIPTSMGIIRYEPKRMLADRRWAAINAFLTSMKALPGDEREQIADALCPGPYNEQLRMMSPTEVGELSLRSGATIGCHTHGHELLDTISLEAARASISRAQALLAGWTGHAPAHFSYPNGNHSPEIAQLVIDLGFRSAVTTHNALWVPGTKPHLVPRIGIGRFDNLNLFRAKVAGIFAGP